jgi:hypothetical protein
LINGKEYKNGTLIEDMSRQTAGSSLRIPGEPMRDFEGRFNDLQEKLCRPAETDVSNIISAADIDWPAIISILRHKGLLQYPCGPQAVVIHALSVKNDQGEELFGFPLIPGSCHFKDLVPAISYVSSLDGKLHIFFTRAFYEDYLQISHILLADNYPSFAHRNLQILRWAEIIDHECFENSNLLVNVPEGRRHHMAALRARYFTAKAKLSPYHKWAIDTLATTTDGCLHLEGILNERRPSDQDPEQRRYERHFVRYLKNAAKRIKHSEDAQVKAHHIMRVYRHGDWPAFFALSESCGIEAVTLNDRIEAVEKKEVLREVRGFSVDRSLTDSSETNVEIDYRKGIVRKMAKVKYFEFISQRLMKDRVGKQFLLALCSSLYATGSVDVYSNDGQMVAAAYIYNLYRVGSASRGFLRPDEAQVVYDALSDYQSMTELLASYTSARDRLGGLIAEFAVINGVIYQERVIPLTECLVELAQGKGYFRGLGNASLEQKVQIGKDLLQKCVAVTVEAAHRGMLIVDGKLTNFGVTANGEVVLFDLGPATFLSLEMPEIAMSLYDFEGLNAMNMSRLLNLAILKSNEGVVSRIKDKRPVEELGEALARVWIEMLSGRVAAENARPEWDWANDGKKLTERISRAIPRTPEEIQQSARLHRRITFVPTALAREQIFRVIIQEYEKAKKTVNFQRGLPFKSAPPRQGTDSFACGLGIYKDGKLDDAVARLADEALARARVTHYRDNIYLVEPDSEIRNNSPPCVWCESDTRFLVSYAKDNKIYLPADITFNKALTEALIDFESRNIREGKEDTEEAMRLALAVFAAPRFGSPYTYSILPALHYWRRIGRRDWIWKKRE